MSTLCLSLVMTTMMMSMSLVEGFSGGAPNYVCESMRPSHPAAAQVFRPDVFPYIIQLSSDTALPGEVITVTVSTKEPSDTLQGLLSTVQDSGSNLVGGFIISPEDNLQLLDCTVSSRTVQGSAVTHTQRLQTNSQSFRWQVPGDAVPGSQYTIRLTVVKTITTYWVSINNTFTVGQAAANSIHASTTATTGVAAHTETPTEAPTTTAGAVIDTTTAPPTTTTIVTQPETTTTPITMTTINANQPDEAHDSNMATTNTGSTSSSTGSMPSNTGTTSEAPSPSTPEARIAGATGSSSGSQSEAGETGTTSATVDPAATSTGQGPTTGTYVVVWRPRRPSLIWDALWMLGGKRPGRNSFLRVSRGPGRKDFPTQKSHRLSSRFRGRPIDS